MAWPSLADQRTRVRDLLNESTAAFYLDAQINRWLNDGERDVAAKGLCIEDIQTVTTTANQRMVDAFCVKVLYVEYVPATGKSKGLIKASPLQIGRNPHLIPDAAPALWFPWGKQIGIEPKPGATIYDLNVYTAELPSIEMSEDADVPQVPTAFQPWIIQYAFCRGLIKARLFASAAKVYARYILNLQILRDDVIAKYFDTIQDTRVPNKVQVARPSR